MALGAQLGDVLWLVLGKGLRLALLGLCVGLVGAFGIGRLLASLTPELAPKDPLTFIGVAGLLVGVAMFACWLPARRAARVDPMIALRAE
jgi:ABC-type antimicrobial peptide transport system permease subunit